MKLTLVSHALCPYVQRAVIALKEKGVPFERIDIDLAAKPDWFLAISPLGKTPVLLADGEAIFESAVICEYLEESHAPPLHPADPLARARHRAWVEFGSAVLNAIWTLYTAKDEDACAAAARVLEDRFAQVEKVLSRRREGAWFGGRNFSLVDAAFGPVFRYFDVFDAVAGSPVAGNPVAGTDIFAKTPAVRTWRAALRERPSVRSAVGADYPELLRAFVVRQGGVLGARFAAACEA